MEDRERREKYIGRERVSERETERRGKRERGKRKIPFMIKLHL